MEWTFGWRGVNRLLVYRNFQKRQNNGLSESVTYDSIQGTSPSKLCLYATT